MATAFIEDGLDFGLARAKEAGKVFVNNSDSECNCEFFPCPEDKNNGASDVQSVQTNNGDEQGFGFQSNYGDITLM